MGTIFSVDPVDLDQWTSTFAMSHFPILFMNSRFTLISPNGKKYFCSCSEWAHLTITSSDRKVDRNMIKLAFSGEADEIQELRANWRKFLQVLKQSKGLVSLQETLRNSKNVLIMQQYHEATKLIPRVFRKFRQGKTSVVHNPPYTGEFLCEQGDAYLALRWAGNHGVDIYKYGEMFGRSVDLDFQRVSGALFSFHYRNL